MLIMQAAYEIRAGSGSRWTKFALGANSQILEDAIAVSASFGFNSQEDAKSAFLNNPALAEEFRPLAEPMALSLATIWSTKADRRSREAAIIIFREAQISGVPLSRHQEMLYLSALLGLGEYSEARRALRMSSQLTADFRLSVETDLLNPSVFGSLAKASAWNKLFSRVFRKAGVSPPVVDLSAGVPFDTLEARAGKDVDGPLVSVIMSTFRRGAQILTSVQSVLNQTYRNIEVLIVDDASGPANDEVLDEIQDLDPRITVHRLSENKGTYVARNFGIAQARGLYIATQDDDDWLHPLRIEEQVAAIANTPGAVASRSQAIRVKPDMTFFWPGYERHRIGASSLLFRRDLIDTIGYFDEVRKGADSEFAERVQKFSQPIIDVQKPLSLTRLDESSLSRSDFRYGWRHPDREFYVNSYRAWHEYLAKEEKSPCASVPPTPRRLPFAAPRSFSVSRQEGEFERDNDVVVFLDLTHEEQATAFLSANDSAGSRTFAVVDVRDPVAEFDESATPILHLIRSLHDSGVPLRSSTDLVEAGTAVVLASGMLTYGNLDILRHVSSTVHVASWAPRGPLSLTDHIGIRERLETELGIEPAWFAPTVQIQREWEEAGWSLPSLSEIFSACLLPGQSTEFVTP